MVSNLKRFSFRGIVALILVLTLLSGEVFSVSAAPGDTTRVSVDSSGVQANGMSRFASVSADARFVVFESDASNLISGDTNGTNDIFVKDRQTGQTSRVSVDSAGLESNGDSGDAAISADGRFVSFSSAATNLISGDTNGVADVFLRDRQLGTTTRISVGSSGEQANNSSDFDTSISSDGRYVAFQSNANNLVSGDTNGIADIFVHDNQTGITERITVASDGTEANAFSGSGYISANGLAVVFASNATNLVAGDTNGKLDIFVRDLQTDLTTRVSVSSSGGESNQGGNAPSISGDGRYVTFSSTAVNLITPEPLSNNTLYLHDRQTGTTIRASNYSDGNEMIGWAEESFISANGRYIAFEFDDKGDSLPRRWIYIRDLQLGLTKQVTPTPEEFGAPVAPALSADGTLLVYHARGSNFVSGDTNGNFDVFAYEVLFTVDSAPTVSSVHTVCGVVCSPSASTVSFSVTFSESVTGVTVDDFSLNVTGSVSGASVTDVSGSGNTYTVNVNTGTGDGTLRLDVVDNDSIQDTASKPLGGTGAGNGNFNTGDVYLLDKSLPAATSISRADANPTEAASVNFNVTFSESVVGVDGSDFTVSTIGSISGASISNVSGSGNLYVVTASTGTGDGSLHIDLIDNDSITDVNTNPLGGSGVGNGNFTLGEFYTIDKNPPTVLSISLTDANPTAAGTVRFTVTFSEAVHNVDFTDFVLTTTSVSGASFTEIVPTDTIYTVTVNTGTGNGTIRLDVIDDDSILDSANRPLGGIGIGNGNFIGGTYTVNKFTIVLQTESFRSTGVNDGWVLESSEDSNTGGTKNATAKNFKLGDDNQDRQFRAILHFPTYYLPDNAVITQAILTLKRQDVIGTDPFTTHQNIVVDIRNGYFGNFNLFSFLSLELADFLAPADVYSVGRIQNNPAGDVYWTLLDNTAFSSISLTGITQIRLGFLLDDNDDLGEDSIRFYSGDAIGQRDRPHLQIQYYVPR